MTDSPATDAAAELQSLADEVWTGLMASQPLYATAIGDRGHLAELSPNDPAASDREARRLGGQLTRARALPDEGLTPADRVTRDALVDLLAFELGVVESHVAEWSVDPLDGPQLTFFNVPSFQPVATVEDGESLVARWREMGPWVDRHVAGLREAAPDGLVAPRALVDSVVDELDHVLGTPDEQWTLALPAAAERPGWSSADRDRFAGAVTDAIRDLIRPAFERQRAYLADDLRPIARPDDRAGLSHVPGGAESYRRLVAAHTTHDLDPEAIHAIGLEEVARIDAGFEELGGRLLGTATAAETIARLRDDATLRFTTRDEVRETAEASLRRANKAIPDWFGRLPLAPCEVVVMGDHESAHSTVAYYRQPAADGSRPGSYYINTTLPETRPRYEAEALAFHEAVPGHHLQLAIAQELTELPAFRRFGGPTAFVEGWGLYSERLSEEMGLYSGPLDGFGVLSYDAWRACRLVVDTGMHALGWSRREAIDFMLAHTALAENNIVNEVNRYLAIPGQALAYKMGQREILALRAQAEAALGATFDIRIFHDVVLGEGTVGLKTIRGVVEGWIGSASA
jgi:uncharacterized protein (DUF885 family)